MKKVVRLLEDNNIQFSFVDKDELEKSEDIVFVLADNINYKSLQEQGIAHRQNKVFYFHRLLSTLLIGPLVLDKEDPCLYCSISNMKQQGTENLLTVCADKEVPFLWDKLTEVFLKEFFQIAKSDAGYLERYHCYLENINFNSGETKQFRLVKDEFCSFCGELEEDNENSFSGVFHKDIKPEPEKYRINTEVKTDELFKRYYDTTTGVFTHFYREYLSSNIPAYGLELKLAPNYVEAGFGRAYSKKRAEDICRLEAIERYCGCFDRKTESKIYASYEEVKDIAINPERLGLHTTEEWEHPAYRIKRYSETLPVYWKWVYSMREKRKLLIPEQSIYYGDNFYRDDSANRFVYESSNGMALGSSFEEAVLHGLFEVIERDNFLCEWYNRFPLQEIDVESTNLKELKELIFLLKQSGIEVRFFDISMELGIPTVWALIHNTNGDAAMKCYNAAGSNFNPEKALESAALEVLTSLPIYEKQIKESEEMRKRVNMLISNPKAVTEFHDHVLYYASQENSKILDFALKTDNCNSIKEVYKAYYKENKYKNSYLSEDLEELLDKVLLYYDDAYIVDLTPKLIEKQGLHVAKVFVPGMLPIAFGQQYKRIINKRILDERIRRGLSTEFDMNLNPHPFP
jgi:ribosomal protein S12 methylthiotransferase accessory factor